MSSPGELLGGRYRLDDRIAAGGMGEVWQATDTVLGRAVAVKTLLADRATDPGFQRRFRHEARALAALRHSGVVAVYDFGSTGNEDAYLVMARVDGRPLNQVLAGRGRLTPDETMSVVAQAARALEAAHAAGIVHRDVKPGNLLVEPDGTVVLVDFGVARSAHSGTVTGAREVVGTALYIAPEQVTRQQTGPAADVYALGALAYHCLAGHPPFQGDNPIAVALQHIEDEPPPLPADIPAPVRDLVRTALSKNPAARFASAGAMADAADAAVSGTGSTGTDATPAGSGATPAGGNTAANGATAEGLAATRADAPWFGIAGVPMADDSDSFPPAGTLPPSNGSPADGSLTPSNGSAVGAATSGPGATGLSPEPASDVGYATAAGPHSPDQAGSSTVGGGPAETRDSASTPAADGDGPAATRAIPKDAASAAVAAAATPPRPTASPGRTAIWAPDRATADTAGAPTAGAPTAGTGATGTGAARAGVGGAAEPAAPELVAPDTAGAGRRRRRLPVLLLVAVAVLGLGGLGVAAALGAFSSDPAPTPGAPAAPAVSGPPATGGKTSRPTGRRPGSTGEHAAHADEADPHGRPAATRPAETAATPAGGETGGQTGGQPGGETGGGETGDGETGDSETGGGETGGGGATTAPPATDPTPGGEETGGSDDNGTNDNENG